MLPFEAADMGVLLSNLLDNAIEANRSYCGSKKIHVTALWKKSFLFSIRNTSNPVRIENNTIQTTKPDPQLHGFGLSNVKLILEKYNGDFTMDYEAVSYTHLRTGYGIFQAADGKESNLPGLS